MYARIDQHELDLDRGQRPFPARPHAGSILRGTCAIPCRRVNRTSGPLFGAWTLERASVLVEIELNGELSAEVYATDEAVKLGLLDAGAAVVHDEVPVDALEDALVRAGDALTAISSTTSRHTLPTAVVHCATR